MSQIFNINPRRFLEIYAEILAEVGGQEVVNNWILQQKCIFIEDLFRVKKVLGSFNKAHLLDIGNNAVSTFDEYYELDLDQLELKLAYLSAKLSRMMRDKVDAHNRASWNPKPSDEDDWGRAR